MKATIRATVLIMTALLILTGCNKTRVNHYHVGPNAETQPSYVKCVGQFTRYEVEYPWFENWVEIDGMEVHDDGLSPRVIFQVSSPEIYADRTVGILYKYEGENSLIPPDVSLKGEMFFFEVPEEFFIGKYENIDNIHIREFGPIP